MLNNQKGSILILVYGLIFVLLSLSASVIAHSIQEKKAFDISKQRLEAFYAAEAGLDSALSTLQVNTSYSGTGADVPASFFRSSDIVGQYTTTVVDLGGSLRSVSAIGYAPQMSLMTGILRQRCSLDGVARIASTPPPASFYDHAIFSAGDVEFNGNSYDVTGSVVYADSISNPGRVNGTVTHDVTISPLTPFDFQSMRDEAVAQGNLYDAARLASGAAFPISFWYTNPTNPSDPTTGVPNVVYVEGDMTVKGNTTAGGFFLVVGNVLTDPTVTSDTTLSGNVTVNGCIYSTGEFELNGGGNSLNVNGGIWAGEEADLKGNSKVTYNADYMAAVKNFVDNASDATVQLLSWRQSDLYN